MAAIQKIGAGSGFGRDARIDLVRGLALLCIFVDHIPGNHLAKLTLQSFGFSDAAEVFVLLAGVSAGIVYGRLPLIGRQGSALAKIFDRSLTIYLAHVALMLSVVVGLTLVGLYAPRKAILLSEPVSFFANDIGSAVAATFGLSLQPEYLDILPLYLVLFLVWLPLFLALARNSITLALAVSFGVWLAANALSINLPSQRDGGWFFNPFAWQLLFSIGLAVGLARLRGLGLGRSRVLLALAICFLAFAFVAAAPWNRLPNVAKLHVIDPALVQSMSKSYLSLWRVAHLICLMYVVAHIMPRDAKVLTAGCTSWIVTLGRNSLPAFVLVTMLSFAGWAALMVLGWHLSMQIVVNALGLAAIVAFAAMQSKARREKARPIAAVAAARNIRLEAGAKMLKKGLAVAFAMVAAWTPARAGEVRRERMASAALGRDVSYTIYLPKATSAQVRLPLLMLLHGAGGDEMSWLDKGGVERVADQLIAEGRIPPVAIVMPNGGDCWWIDTPSCRYESFLWNELEPQLARQLPLASGREARFVVGASAGGFGAARLALGKPDRIAAAGALSPAIYAELPPDFSQVRQRSPFVLGDGKFNAELWQRMSYVALLPEYAKQKHRVAFRLASGDMDPYGTAFEAAAFHRQLMSVPGQSVQLRISGGVHDWKYWTSALAEMLPALLSAPESSSLRSLSPEERGWGSGKTNAAVAPMRTSGYGRW